MKSIKELLIQCWYDKVDMEIVREWASAFIIKNDDIPEQIFDLLSCDRYQVEVLLSESLRSQREELSKQSEEAEILSAQLLIDVATKYLNGQGAPMDVCRVVDNIDANFVGAQRGLPDNIAYYPSWLGNLWNSCDWCDEEWTRESAPRLKEDLSVQLNNISTWVESHNKRLKVKDGAEHRPLA